MAGDQPTIKKGWPFKSFRCPPEWLEKLSYIARVDSKKKGQRVTDSDVIRDALAYLFRRRTHTLYPPKRGEQQGEQHEHGSGIAD